MDLELMKIPEGGKQDKLALGYTQSHWIAMF